MNSAGGSAVLPALGFPIRVSADRRLFSASPRLIAAVHALLRLLVPRHPPCALPILTVIRRPPGRKRPSEAPGDTRFGSDRRDRCQLAWLCSFQGPREGALSPARAPCCMGPAGSRPVSQNSTACARTTRAGAPGSVDIQVPGRARTGRYAPNGLRRRSIPGASLDRR
jgi:hypothetical protein